MRFNHLIVPAAMAAALSLPVAPVLADEAAALLAAGHLEAGSLSAGDAELRALLQRDPNNGEARLGLGMIRMVQALEHLSQGLYRYGLQAPEDGMLPVVGLPLPKNPSPDPITYDALRDLLIAFHDDLERAEITLGTLGSLDAKVPLNVFAIAYDVDGDGTVSDSEHFVEAVRMLAGGEPPPEELPVIAFDLADGIWLRGYANLLMGFTDFMLAHDWRVTFETTFHLFFPNANLPMREARTSTEFDTFGFEATSIADAIAFIHLINWPVIEPERLAELRSHLKATTALSRQNWEAILAETDNDREWLPSPRQDPALGDIRVTWDQVKNWQLILNEFDLILDGGKLLPHWRFAQGVNLRRVLEEPLPFDLVLWITGSAALPYLEDGPVATEAEWRDLTRAFGPNFGGYAAWFN